MKKILICITLLICLCGCQLLDRTNSSNVNKYYDLVDLLENHYSFNVSSEFFDVSSDITKISEGYRFYIIIDNAKIAMYNLKAVAIEEDVDYTNTMAANIGIFEDVTYSIIPNQINVDSGFVKGVSISGISKVANPKLHLLVEWNNADMSITNKEFIEIDLNSGVTIDEQ